MPYLLLLCSYTWHCGIVATHARGCRCRTLSIHCLTIIWLPTIYVSICKPCIRLTYPIATSTVDTFALVCFFNQIQDAITNHWFYCYGNCAILVTFGLWLQSPWWNLGQSSWGEGVCQGCHIFDITLPSAFLKVEDLLMWCKAHVFAVATCEWWMILFCSTTILKTLCLWMETEFSWRIHRMGLPSNLSEKLTWTTPPQTQELLVLSPYLCRTTSATLTIENGGVTPTSIMREFRMQSWTFLVVE